MNLGTARTANEDQLTLREERMKEVSALDASNRQQQKELADLLLRENRFTEAISHLEKLVEAEPGEPQALADLACTYQRVRDYGNAIGLFERVLTANNLTPSERAVLYERLGYCRLMAQKKEEAVRAFENAISLDTDSFRSYVGLGLCMTHAGRTEEARPFFEKAIFINPGCADAYNNLGMLAWSEGRIEEGLALFKRALEIDPVHRDALPNYLSMAFSLELYEQAESLLRCYVNTIPDNPDLGCQLAYCHLKLGREQDARKLLQDVLVANPDHEDARALLEQCEEA